MAYRQNPAILDSSVAYYKLAHQHRCVFFYRCPTPSLQGAGADLKVMWDEYDKFVGPLVSGELFKDCRRAGAPLEVMPLPFADSWPTPLTKETYNYQGHWPGRGEKAEHIIEHYLKAPYIGDGVSKQYKEAFRAAERQFIEHFREKGWKQTEMQCMFMGKNTHRTQYGVNMWWTTDEPYHWDDWLALEFFCRLWTDGRGDGEARQWSTRADISRPQWQANILDGIAGSIYFGGVFAEESMYRRCRILQKRAGFDLRVYGAANPDTRSNAESVAWVLDAWLKGANAALPWQTVGSEAALDGNDKGADGGNALLAPGKRFGVGAVADLRMKAFRDAEQIVEYLNLLEQKCGLNRDQVGDMVMRVVGLRAGRAEGAGADNADALRFAALADYQIAGLRRAAAQLILRKGGESRP